MMKKILIMMLTFTLILSFTLFGCKEEASEEVAEEEILEEEEEAIEEEAVTAEEESV